ncbi:hypothetical protein FB567DRAFT_529887 [Paraphoma chrysanthemicola]|uniref:Cylicin I n=1 Tax=Paraphoma chrysanthemicola TaxID=798071 RepID=A0A8K0R3P8_9PLEO|nr:hypothetical protein FB567DRAFT_529887 [Paraphoma chrysanthemicola]
MSFLRSTALRASSLTRAARPARYIRAAELQPWQRAVQRRMYASEHGAHGEAKGSEVPWIAAAVAGTVGGLYFTVTQDLGHGPGHDSDHHAEAHETHGKNEGEDEDTADKSGSQGGPKDEVKSKSSDKPKDEGEKSGEDKEAGEPKADENDKASPDKSDKPDARGKAKSSNETSGKQEGLSNTDTHHSTDVSNLDDKSKKGEGVAETAKVKGTVSTERPPAENKEERGKAQVDKDA